MYACACVCVCPTTHTLHNIVSVRFLVYFQIGEAPETTNASPRPLHSVGIKGLQGLWSGVPWRSGLRLARLMRDAAGVKEWREERLSKGTRSAMSLPEHPTRDPDLYNLSKPSDERSNRRAVFGTAPSSS